MQTAQLHTHPGALRVGTKTHPGFLASCCYLLLLFRAGLPLCGAKVHQCLGMFGLRRADAPR